MTYMAFYGYETGAIARRSPMADVTVIEAECIGCGCTDSKACPGGRKPDAPDTLQTEPCSWVWVNRAEGRGLCTSCNDGDWEPR